jgi:hypothetical protein
VQQLEYATTNDLSDDNGYQAAYMPTRKICIILLVKMLLKKSFSPGEHANFLLKSGIVFPNDCTVSLPSPAGCR